MASLPAADAPKHWLASDFKLALQDPGCPAALAIASHGMTAEQVRGTGSMCALQRAQPLMLTCALQVMADYLRMFVKYVLVRLEETYGAVDANPDNIQWCAAGLALATALLLTAMRSCSDATAGFHCLEAWLSACCCPGA
jgi:hypothetical protein